MQDLQLPVLSGSSGIDKAFEAMIREGVSGVVVKLPFGYLLLHYTQVLAAWETNVAILSDIPLDCGHFLTSVDYVLKSVASMTASFRSSHDVDASYYMAKGPGYSCDGPIRHFYPPNKRRDTDDCVVIACTGKVP